MELSLYDPSGRLVRVLESGPATPGTRAGVWDARDQAGRPLPGGFYLGRLLVDGQELASRRVVLLR